MLTIGNPIVIIRISVRRGPNKGNLEPVRTNAAKASKIVIRGPREVSLRRSVVEDIVGTLSLISLTIHGSA